MSGPQYPYDQPHDIPLYDDPYGRPITWLFQSIIKYGRELLMRDVPIPRDMKVLVSSQIDFCDQPKSPLHIQKYLELYPPHTPNKRRRVLPVQLLDTSNLYISEHLRDAIESDQVIIVHHFGPLSWIIFFVSITRCTIEKYTMGDVDPLLSNTLLDKLQDHIHVILGNRFQSNHRLHIPQSFHANPIIMVFTLVHYLHQHGRYLDLSCATLMNFQCLHVKNVIKHHDSRLGQLHINRLLIPIDSFVVPAKQKPPGEFPPLWELGWAVIDVIGDGNCGFYALMLGHQNIRDTSYSIYNHSSANYWKTKTMDLRRVLQDQSRRLLTMDYDDSTRTIENENFWLNFSVGYDDHPQIESLSNSFVHPSLADDLYFDNNDFRTKYSNYHMDATWGPHVFSYTYGVRVVVITRVTSYKTVPIVSDTKHASKKQRKSLETLTETILSYTWETRIHDCSKSLRQRVQILHGIYRMPDDEYARIPTIEILYHYGWIGRDKKGKAINDHHHFQFLRRVILDDIPIPTDPSSITLRECHELGKVPTLPNSKSCRKLKARRNATLTKLYRSQKSNPDSESNVKMLTRTQMLFDPVSLQYYVKEWDDNRNDFGDPRSVDDAEDFNDELVLAAVNFAGEWMGPNIKPTIGDTRETLYTTLCLFTRVPIVYQQLNHRYCLSYSMANALLYCNFLQQASWFHGCAPALSTMDFDLALAELRQKMMDFVPIIGLPTIFGHKTKRHNRFQRPFTWDVLFSDLTVFPTLVIPKVPTGKQTHAFCVVDDLIFDSVFEFALPLCMESVKCIFNDVEPTIYMALRFNTKVSPPKGKGPKTKGTYDRQVVYHWDHPSRPTPPS